MKKKILLGGWIGHDILFLFVVLKALEIH